MSKTIELLIAGLSGFICMYAGFKIRQSSGKEFVNDLSTDFGGGSFKDSLVGPVVTFFWRVLFFISFFCALGFFFVGISCKDCDAKTQGNSKIEAPSNQSSETAQPPIDTSKVEVNSSNDAKVSTQDKIEHTDKALQQNNDVKKVYSEEEIQQLEKEKNYSGNDPVIRARLGLPPKE